MGSRDAAAFTNGLPAIPAIIEPLFSASNRNQIAWRIGAVSLYIILAVVRLPLVWLSGRMDAEEGSIYFHNAWVLPWRQALLHAELGYLNLPANLATLAARYFVSLENAPLVTAACALAVQAIPIIILATSRDAWLRRPSVLLAAAALLALQPVSDEVWLNTITSQFHLAIAAGLCLALDAPTGVSFIARALLLFVVPLSSPAAIVMAPLFAARAVISRDRGRLIMAICIAGGALLQIGLFHSTQPGRGHAIGPAVLASILVVKQVALPLLGSEIAAFVARSLRHAPFLGLLLVVLPLSAAAIALWRTRMSAAVWLAASGVALAVLSYYAGTNSPIGLLSVAGSQRYAFAPTALLSLGVLAIATQSTPTIAPRAQALAAWLLAVAILQQTLAAPSEFAKGPAWATQIAALRADPNRPIAIWPAGWFMTLPTAQDTPDHAVKQRHQG